MSALWAERSASQRPILSSRLDPPPNYSEAREAFTEELTSHLSVLGRLVTAASFYDPLTGRYCHKLAAHYGTEETDRALRRLHQEVFVAWLSLPLKQQQADVVIYLASVGMKAEWFDFRKMAKTCIPKSATLPERDLFLLDLELVQALQRY